MQLRKQDKCVVREPTLGSGTSSIDFTASEKQVPNEGENKTKKVPAGGNCPSLHLSAISLLNQKLNCLDNSRKTFSRWISLQYIPCLSYVV